MSSGFGFLSIRPARGAIVCLMAAVALSCDEYVVDNPILEPPPIAPAVRLEVTPNTLTLTRGASAFLVAQAFDANGRRVSATIEWTSSDPSIATIGRFDGWVTSLTPGTATMTAATGALRAGAVVTVYPQNPPAALLISPDELILNVPYTARLWVIASDVHGEPTSASVVWTSQDPGVATVDTSGLVTAISVGSTSIVATAGDVSASIPVSVAPPDFLVQWADQATASSEYDIDSWAASRATGWPDVPTCADDPNAWASFTSNTMEWLELSYAQPVRPTEIRIYEVWAPGSIVKVEVFDLAGRNYEVYSATPSTKGACLRKLTIPVTGVTELVNRVRITLDQRVLQDWNEIDAVRLSGYRNN